jgi:hypothetical protein
MKRKKRKKENTQKASSKKIGKKRNKNIKIIKIKSNQINMRRKEQ